LAFQVLLSGFAGAVNLKSVPLTLPRFISDPQLHVGEFPTTDTGVSASSLQPGLPF